MVVHKQGEGLADLNDITVHPMMLENNLSLHDVDSSHSSKDSVHDSHVFEDIDNPSENSGLPNEQQVSLLHLWRNI